MFNGDDRKLRTARNLVLIVIVTATWLAGLAWIRARFSPPPIAVHPSAADTYVASKATDVFHRGTCGHVSRISAEDVLAYGTRAPAAQGRKPCPACNP